MATQVKKLKRKLIGINHRTDKMKEINRKMQDRMINMKNKRALIKMEIEFRTPRPSKMTIQIQQQQSARLQLFQYSLLSLHIFSLENRRNRRSRNKNIRKKMDIKTLIRKIKRSQASQSFRLMTQRGEINLRQVKKILKSLQDS